MTTMCFVAMPFDGSCDAAYYNAMCPACAALGITCHRVDASLSEENIIREIVTCIYEADAVIVDITGSSPNVFYELGIAHALPYPNKTIMVAKEGTRIPFDIQSFRIIMYDADTPEGLRLLRKGLEERLSKLITGSADSSNPVQDNIHYYERLVLTQAEAAERHKITLDKALDVCTHSLILIGTTLFSLRGQPPQRKVIERVALPEFRELSLVMRDPGASDVSERIRRQLVGFLHDGGTRELLSLNRERPKVSLYFCSDFVRFSAAYIDHMEAFGMIRITHSIYGCLMEDAPSYLLTRKRSLRLFENYVKAWEDLKARRGTRRIVEVEEFDDYRRRFT